MILSKGSNLSGASSQSAGGISTKCQRLQRSSLLALDLPLKVLVWQSADGRVWVSMTSVAYLQARYAIPQGLVGNLAVVNAVIE